MRCAVSAIMQVRHQLQRDRRQGQLEHVRFTCLLHLHKSDATCCAVSAMLQV
jgi:hypothetical protein